MATKTLLHGLMKHTTGLRCSDLFLQAGERPLVRLQGDLVEVEKSGRLSQAELQELVASIVSPAQQERLARQGYLDFAISDAEGVNWRAHIYQQWTGLALALRPLAARSPTLESLNLPPQLARIADYVGGLVLVTGATGSGKTSTLAAIIERMNATQSRHVITIEDPIEYVHQNDRSLIQQRMVGADVPTFHQGVVDSLHEDPDVLVVGELRDYETVRAALTAAETGILVLGTLHCNDATQSVERILDLFEGEEQPLARVMLSHSLRAVVSQCLVEEQTGKGRVPACEIMFQSAATSGLIRVGREHEIRSAIQVSRAEGMILLDEALSALVRSGRVTAEAAVRHARDPQRFSEEHVSARERPWFLGGPAKAARAAAAKERRHEPRVKALALVNVREVEPSTGDLGEVALGRTRDLSHDGLRLELDHPLLIGTRVRLSLALENEVLEVEAGVRSIEELGKGQYAIGLRFGRLGVEEAKKLDNYLRVH
jgi:twitching motility protein PilT